MPFFYSQYLTDEKVKRVDATSGGSTSTAAANRGSRAGKQPERRPSTSPSSNTLRRLVWHSNIGASGKRNKAQTNFKPLQFSADGKKVVHFSTIEVQPFRFDWSLANDVFYSRKELTAMGQSRFDDAATLRQQRHLDERGRSDCPGDCEGGQSIDDVDISKKNKGNDVATLLSMALSDDDQDEHVSIRGIEHFVYPDLQQEMIRRKKEVHREVLEFVRSKRPDPQGWRLAQHSRKFSQWARNVAIEKGMKYQMNNASTTYPEVEINEEDVERFKKSQDELEASQLHIRGSSSFSVSSPSNKTSASFTDASCSGASDAEDPILSAVRETIGDSASGDQDEARSICSQPPSTEDDIEGNAKGGDEDDSAVVSQPPGAKTGEV